MTKLRVLFVVLVAGSVLTIPAPSPAAGPTITGAGSTFSEVAIKQWIGDVANQGIAVNYSGVGSTAGRTQYIDNKQNIDFAVSEIPFDSGEVAQLNSKGISYQYNPIVAGGTAIMYNVKNAAGARITTLQLSGDVAAKIFTGKITRWNDPEIAALNGSLALPDKTIKPVVRSDGSGTSAQFSAYLIKMFPSVVGNFFGGASNVSIWPEFSGYVAQPRSDGVANFVAGNENSITYVEAAYAEQRRFPVAGVKNAAGKFAKPDSGNVALALEKATFNSDRSQNLDGVYTHPAEAAYPISSYSYMITPTKAADITPAEADVLGKFMIYYACRGQRNADALGYSPLPKNLVQGVFDAVAAIPGAPTPPALTAEACPNPTLTGEVKPPTPAQTSAPTTSPGGGGATTTTAPAGGGEAATTAPPGGGGGGAETIAPSTGGATSAGPGSTAPSGGGTSSGGSTAPKSSAGSTSSTKPKPTTGGSTPKTSTLSKPKTSTGSGTAGSGQGTTGGAVTGTGGGEALATGELPAGNSEFGQRLIELEARVAKLEARAYGEEPADLPIDPALKEELLKAAGNVESQGGGGPPIGVLVLAGIVFGPFLAASLRSLNGRLRAARR